MTLAAEILSVKQKQFLAIILTQQQQFFRQMCGRRPELTGCFLDKEELPSERDPV